MEDDELVSSFEECRLDNKAFHHADHVKLAFLYLHRYPALEALSRFSACLAKFAAANGKPELYHETITWAFLLLIRERMARAGEQTWSAFTVANAELLSWSNNILKRYYREETLSCALARSTFVFPDRNFDH